MFVTEKPVGKVSYKKVLVVDDEDIILELVQNYLEDLAHCEVVTANSGMSALIKVTRQKPDAIILDMMMPGIDGMSLIQHLRVNPITQTIPIFLLTASLEYTDPQKFRSLGVAGALTKHEDLYELIKEIIKSLNWMPSLATK